MIDIFLEQDENGAFDFSIENGDIQRTDGLETAIWVSLFTDARATEAQVLIPEYRRGWPGNALSSVPGRQLGGYLWLVDQRRLTQSTLNDAIDYARGALDWFLVDNIARSVIVDGEIVPRSGIQLSITITSYLGVTKTYYVNLWEVTGAN